jgi:hypothetical protein
MNIRIVKRPIGSAPEDARDAWIGLLLPVHPQRTEKIEWRYMDISSGSRSVLALRFKGIFGRGQRLCGYAVDTAQAFDILEGVNATAAGWWRKNAAHLLKPGLAVLFDEECCLVEDSSDGEHSK